MREARHEGTRTAADVGLDATYDALWRQGLRALSKGAVEPEPLPLAGTTRWGISAVLRPRPWSPALVECAAAVAACVGTAGVVYDERGLHVTLRAIEGFREPLAPDHADVRAYRNAVADGARVTAPLRVRFAGLTATSGGVLVQGWPCPALQAFRHALFDRLAASGLASRGPETSPDTIRRTAHASLALFEGPLADAAGLAGLIGAHRSTAFGEWVFPEVWLVGYRRSAGRVALVEYGRFPFNGS